MRPPSLITSPVVDNTDTYKILNMQLRKVEGSINSDYAPTQHYISV